MIDYRVYLDLEKALTQRLQKTWAALAPDLFAPIHAAIKAKNWAKAYDLARELDASSVISSNREYIKYVLLACANFGAATANPKDHTFVSAGNFGGFLDQVVQNMVTLAESTVNAELYREAVQLIAAAQQPAAKAEVRKDFVDGDPANLLAPADRYVKDFVSFAGAGMQGVKLVSTLHSSRLAVWGFTAEADTIGFDYYTLTPVLDNRTSKFCRMLGERNLVFRVQQAKDLINRALSAQTADEIKAIQPWPPQDKASMESYWGMDADELAANGWATPPFHPFCRTLLTRVDHQPNTGEQPEEEQQHPEEEPAEEQQGYQVFKPVTAEDFAELGLTVTPEEVGYWNAYVGKSPVEVMAGLMGMEPLDLMNNADESNTRLINFNASGDIKFHYDGPIGEAEDNGVASINMVYDPLDGTLYQNYMDVTSDNPEFVGEYVKEYYQSLVDTGQLMDAERLVMQAVGEDGIGTYATMGMTPTDGDWANLRSDIRDDMTGNGPLAFLNDSLPEDQLAVVNDLLSASDPHAIQALAALDYEVDGVPISEILFKDRKVEMVLDLKDTEAVSTFLGDEA